MSDLGYYESMERYSDMKELIKIHRKNMEKRFKMFYTDMTKHYEPSCIKMGLEYGIEILKCPECSKFLNVYYLDDECCCPIHYCKHCFIKLEIGPYIIYEDYDEIPDSIINQSSQEKLPF